MKHKKIKIIAEVIVFTTIPEDKPITELDSEIKKTIKEGNFKLKNFKYEVVNEVKNEDRTNNMES